MISACSKARSHPAAGLCVVRSPGCKKALPVPEAPQHYHYITTFMPVQFTKLPRIGPVFYELSHLAKGLHRRYNEDAGRVNPRQNPRRNQGKTKQNSGNSDKYHLLFVSCKKFFKHRAACFYSFGVTVHRHVPFKKTRGGILRAYPRAGASSRLLDSNTYAYIGI